MDSLDPMLERAIKLAFGLSDGRMGLTPDLEEQELARRRRTLAKQRKQRRDLDSIMVTVVDIMPDGMDNYLVTYGCGHTKTFTLKAGLSKVELANVYGRKLCPACAEQAARDRAKELKRKWGD